MTLVIATLHGRGYQGKREVSAMGKTVGVVLSGCGYLDGSEIHEATLALYSLDRAGARAVCFAPDVELDVVDHRTGEATGAKRSVLAESARIARGAVAGLREAKAADLDALVLPGGYGAAKNLCTFAADGIDCRVNEEVAALVRDVHRQGKPIAALCIAPALVAKLLGADHRPRLTIGTDADTAGALEKMGATHVPAEPDAIVVDEANRLVTTPCYMSARGIAEVGAGIDKAVTRLLAMTDGR